LHTRHVDPFISGDGGRGRGRIRIDVRLPAGVNARIDFNGFNYHNFVNCGIDEHHCFTSWDVNVFRASGGWGRSQWSGRRSRRSCHKSKLVGVEEAVGAPMPISVGVLKSDVGVIRGIVRKGGRLKNAGRRVGVEWVKVHCILRDPNVSTVEDG